MNVGEIFSVIRDWCLSKFQSKGDYIGISDLVTEDVEYSLTYSDRDSEQYPFDVELESNYKVIKIPYESKVADYFSYRVTGMNVHGPHAPHNTWIFIGMDDNYVWFLTNTDSYGVTLYVRYLKLETTNLAELDMLTVKQQINELQQKIDQFGKDLYYNPGDVINNTSSGMWISGTLTTGNKDIFMLLPINKPINASKVTFNLVGLAIRQAGVYLYNKINEDFSEIVCTTTVLPHSGLYLKLTKDDGWGGINNEVVGVYLLFTIKI